MESHSLSSPVAATATSAYDYRLQVPAGHVVISLSQAHYDLAIETLATDSQSNFFDRELRENLRVALTGITRHAASAAARMEDRK